MNRFLAYTILWRTLITSTLAIGAGYIIGAASNSLVTALMLTSIIVAFGLLLIFLRDWTIGIYVFFAWVIIEDSVRKYTGSVILTYFFKDVILILTYLAYFSSRMVRHEFLLNWTSPIVPALSLLVLWGLLSSFYHGVSNWIVPIIGLRMWFIYCPLVFLGIDFAQSPIRIRRILKLWTISALIVSLLGLLQVIFGNVLLNPASTTYEAKLFLEKTGVSGLVLTRPTSVFIDPGRYGKYTIMSLCIMLGVFVFFRQENRKWTKDTALAGVCLGLVFIMNFLSGARVTVVTASFILPIFLFLLQFHSGTGPQVNKAIPSRWITIGLFAVMIIAGALSLIVSYVNPGHLHASLDFYRTIGTYANTHYELHSRNVIYALQNYGLIGSGIGSTSLGLNYFGNPTSFNSIETGFASLIVEFGVVGLILWILIGAGVTLTFLRIARRMRNVSLYGLTVAALFLQILFMFILFGLGAAVYQDYLVSAHLWFFVGLINGFQKKFLNNNKAEQVEKNDTSKRFLSSNRLKFCETSLISNCLGRCRSRGTG